MIPTPGTNEQLFTPCKTFISFVLAKSCKHVQDIEHGSHKFFENDRHWPMEICRLQYRCNIGYRMIGHSDIYCLNGHWSGSPPECKGQFPISHT